jgi:hypothetical protein
MSWQLGKKTSFLAENSLGVKKLGFLKGCMKERSLMSRLQLEKEAARDQSVFCAKIVEISAQLRFRSNQLELKEAAEDSYSAQARTGRGQ